MGRVNVARVRVALAVAVVGGVPGIAAPGVARAEDPKFEYAKPVEVKLVAWKLVAQAGLVYTTGNSQALSAAGGGSASRDDGKNRLQFDAGGAYVQTTQRVGTDGNKDGVIDASELTRETRVTTALWNAKLRYDRFFTERNTVYATGSVLGNEPAGKEFVAAGQAGYSRLLIKDARNELAIEGGYDFTYERDIGNVPTLFIHSLRLFAGLSVNATADTNIGASIEVLLNLNEENGPTNNKIERFEDTRVNARVQLTTKLWRNLSFRFSSTARYDNSPSPAAPLPLPYAKGFVPLAEKLDTITEAALVVTIL